MIRQYLANRRAEAINAFRRIFPHPAAVTRRVEAQRARQARARIADRDRQRAVAAIEAAGWRKRREGCA